MFSLRRPCGGFFFCFVPFLHIPLAPAPFRFQEYQMIHCCDTKKKPSSHKDMRAPGGALPGARHYLGPTGFLDDGSPEIWSGEFERMGLDRSTSGKPS